MTSHSDESFTLPGSRGAQWQRVDLHLHSPGAHTFRCPDGSNLLTEDGRQKVIDAYVDWLGKESVAIGAITDYNAIHVLWFEGLREAAKDQGITLLPGVELSFREGKHGLHILAIFKEELDLDQLKTFLQSIDRDPATPLIKANGEHRHIDLRPPVAEALTDLRDRFDCLLIVAHPDEDDGLFKSLKPEDAARLLSEVRPDAMEKCSAATIKKLRSTNTLAPEFFDRMALVEFSDPKSIQEVGTKLRQAGSSRRTYLKLSANDTDAIRLALHDPDTRVSLTEPQPPSHPRIRGMRVTGSGFLGNLTLEFNDDLNVLIGGRGVGKSAVLETLRYALGLDPYADQSYREGLIKHALQSGGKVEVVLDRPVGNGEGRQYRVSRVWGEEPRVMEADTERILGVAPREILGPTGGPSLFGQREIYAISESEEYRLALLDELVGEEARTRGAAVRDALTKLRANGRAILDVRGKLAKRDEHGERLNRIDYEIGIYEKHGAAEKLREATRLRSDSRHLKSAKEAVQSAEREWGEVGDNLIPPVQTAIRGLERGESQQKELLEEAAATLKELINDLTRVVSEGNAAFAKAGTLLVQLAEQWQAALQPLEDEINRIKQEAQTDTLDPDRLLRLTEERTGIAPLIEELERTEQRLVELMKTRVELINQVRDRRLEEHQLRRERADEITALLGGRLRLEVEFKGQKESYKKSLVSQLKGSGISQTAIDRLVEPEATDGLSLAEAVQAGPKEVQKRFGITSGMAGNLVKWVSREDRLFDVQQFLPHDALRVELRVDEEFRPLDRLSVGQRATAILLLLFALKGRVLGLDQPEDDLDNRFVYEDIVKILREQKGMSDPQVRRQIIAATHNANIPVLGDAELVIVLEAVDGRARVTGQASIDAREIRAQVKAIMEGGDEAFRRRAEKYGGPS